MPESKINVLLLATGPATPAAANCLDEEAKAIVRKIRLGSHRERFDFDSE